MAKYVIWGWVLIKIGYENLFPFDCVFFLTLAQKLSGNKWKHLKTQSDMIVEVEPYKNW